LSAGLEVIVERIGRGVIDHTVKATGINVCAPHNKAALAQAPLAIVRSRPLPYRTGGGAEHFEIEQAR
jgi:hypothetical protein